MDISSELIARVSEYIDRKIKLRELESWLVPQLPILLACSDPDLENLVVAVELGLDELHAGIRSERSVRTELKRLLGQSKAQTVQNEYHRELTSEIVTGTVTTPPASQGGAPG